MATSTRRTVSRQPSKSLKSTSACVEQLASNLAIGGPKLSAMQYMLSINAASQELSNVIHSGWKKSSNSSKATLQSTTLSASAAVKHVAILRNLCPDDVDVERAAVSILGKLVALELFDLATTALTEMHPALCRLVNLETNPQGAALRLLSVPTPPSFPTNPVVLTLISTYLLHALIITARPETTTINALATTLNSPNSTSLLEWAPSLTSLPTKHIDSLLTRAYTSLTKFISLSSSDPKTHLKRTSASPESIFFLRMYALRCLIHTSPGTVETNMVWDQVTRFTATFVKATSADVALEEKCTTVVLSTYADLVERGERRSDRDTFMAIDQKGKGFLGFCEYWMEFTQRAGDICVLQKINWLMKQGASSCLKGQIPEDSESPNTHVPDLRKKILEGSNLCNIFSQATLFLDIETPSSNDELLKAISESTKILNTSTTIITFLQPPTRTADKRTRDEAEFLRMGGKVDRALEKLRRSALKFIESTQSSISEAVHSAVRELLIQSVACWRTCLITPPLETSVAKDALTRALDTLFVLSRASLNVQNPQTFVPAFEYLSTAATILDTIRADSFLVEADDETVDMANYTRCVSGAFYNVAGSLYQATRYGAAVPFLKESCALGARALRLPRAPKSRDEKEWQQLEEQLFRRWELLAVCYSKNSDRKNSYHALLQAIYTFPFFSSGLTAQSDTLALDALFGHSASSAVKQLASLVDRVSYLGACELLLPTEEVSLKSALKCATTPSGTNSTIVDPRIVGVLLERQLDSLEPSRWKERVRDVIVRLLRDALDVYHVGDIGDSSSGMPVRRARILVRCMEFVYRDHHQDGWSTLGFANVDEMGCEIERLVMMSDLGKDTLLSRYGTQYRTASRLWMALHAHRRADPEQNALMTQHADEACRLIKGLLASSTESSPKAIRKQSSPKALKKTSSPQVGRIVSPKTTRTTRQRVPTVPRKAAPVKSKTVLNPKTPKPKTRTATQPVSFNTLKTPPRCSMELPSIKPTLVFDNFDQFLELLELTARILGFLMLILPKAHVLDMARKLSQRQNGVTSDGYVTASIDLAHEYVALGKMKRAASIFNQALEIVRGRHPSPDVAVRFLLRYSESLAMVEEIPKSSTVYIEALELSNQLDLEQKGMSTQQRIHARARVLEMAAMASHTFAAIQYSKGDVVASLDGLLQSIRLWNRAADTLTRLYCPSRSQTTVTEEPDPFSMSSLKEALSSDIASKDSQEQFTPKKNINRRRTMDGLEWRISEGLLSTLFSLSRVYHLGGSAREAEYFAQQAADIAEALNLPPMASRALAKKGEIRLQMGQLEEAHANLTRAEELLRGMPGIDTADVRRLKADYQQRATQQENVEQEFAGTVTMLEELDAAFRQFDNLAFGPRRSLVTSPPKNKGSLDVLAPDLLASVLCRQLWLLRDDVGDAFNALLEKFLSLSYSAYNKAEETALMAKLTLHSVYGRFRADMFLSSLTESTIAVPMGMISTGQFDWTLPSSDILDALANAEKLLWSHLNLMDQKGSVVKVREAAISLALIGAFRTSLGNQRNGVPLVIASLLDASNALSLRRDMLIAIQHKIPSAGCPDDMEWRLIAEDGTMLPRLTASERARFNPAISLSDSEDEDSSSGWLAGNKVVETYWESIRAKYQSQILDFSALSSSRTIGLPANWTIISVSVTHDNGTLFISRQGGTMPTVPLIFCVPLNGRRDHGSGEDEGQLSFENAIDELKDIVHSSNESTKAAINIKPDDEEARSNWWKQRGQLDDRMKALMENIEYCWLGAFKTILNPQPKLSKENVIELRGQFDKIFHLALHVKDTKPKPRTMSHKKSVSKTPSPSNVMLDDAMIECFSTLSPKCPDEELEDLVYFVLDLYQFHGVPVAIAEVDIDQVVVDLRTVLEENCIKRAKKKLSTPSDEHLFLVLDKNVQGLPWESMPILRGRSVSRIPGVDFLHDRVAFAKLKREARGQTHKPEDGAAVDAGSGYYILNPSGDLGRTEDRFRDWSKEMRKMGWDGVVGRPVSELEFVNALRTRDLVVYFGHGGGEQYVRSHRIRSLPTCAATMLWGCSSGALRDMGDFDRTGTPYNYMLAGCPTLVANLWDVTDKDIDKFSQSVFDKLSLNRSPTKEKISGNNISIVAAVAQSRDSCKLKYLTGAAPVVYGIPFYL